MRNQTRPFLTFPNLPRNLVPRFLTFLDPASKMFHSLWMMPPVRIFQPHSAQLCCSGFTDYHFLLENCYWCLTKTNLFLLNIYLKKTKGCSRNKVRIDTLFLPYLDFMSIDTLVLVRAECVRQRLNDVAIKIIASYNHTPCNIAALLAI